MKLNTQLSSGFAAVIILLVIVSVTAYWGLTGEFDGFSEYRRLASANNRTSLFQENMLSVRLAARRFISDPSDQTVQDYRQHFGEMMIMVKEMQENVKKPERAKKVTVLAEQAAKYDTIFVQFVALNKQQDEATVRQGEMGAALRKVVTQIIETVAKENNAEAAVLAGQIQENVMLGRLAAVRLRQSHKAEDFETAKREIQVEAADLAKTLRQKTENGEVQKLLDQFDKDRNAYIPLITTIFDRIQKSNASIAALTQTDLAVAKVTDELKAAYTEEQNALGLRVQQANKLAVTVVTWLSAGAVLAGILLAWLLVRIIQRPIGGEPAEMAAITEKIAGGDLTVRFTHTGHET
ncbi:MAG: hypothetical protein LM550_06710, partial [Candidatus Contendobacter sp.]|nr:hypothetical protein [Gammaproteobacteria bacterium]MCC8993369.1 hypothetical protein [Candidatus Contendobacter sp.]